MKKHQPADGSTRPSLRRSLVLSFAQKYTSLLITLPTLMLLSRLLTPAQIGVYSVAVAFVNIVHMLRDFGTSDYLIQASELDDATVRSAFTVTLAIAWFLGLLLFASSSWMAVFFGEDGLRTVLRVLSINFFLLPFGSTIGALLTRAMRFGIQYKIKTGSQLTQSVVTILLAWFGFGYMSPTWGSVVGMVATVAGCWAWGRAYRVRGLGLTQWRAVALFGSQKTFGSIMSRVGTAAPDFVIGRMLGFAEAGLFSRGKGLVRMFRENIIGAIGSVAFSAFSQRHRDNQAPQALYLKSMTLISGISWPFLAFSSLMAFPIIRIMLGDQWDDAVPILRFLAITALINTTMAHNDQLLTAVGKVWVNTTRITIMQLLRIGVIVTAASYSLNAVAVALIPTAIAGFLYTSYTLVRHTGMQWRGIVGALRSSALVLFSSMALPLCVYYVDRPSADQLWLPLIYAGLGALAGWFFGLWAADHPLWAEIKNAGRYIHENQIKTRLHAS